jgi:hypothetical protein
MVGQQLPQQDLQFVKFPCRRKHNLLLGREMDANLILKNLSDLALPNPDVTRRNGRGSLDPHTQSQCMLMLMRQWDQIFVTEHS